MFLTVLIIIIGIGAQSIVQADLRPVTSTSKAGLAWPNGRWDSIDQFDFAKISWYYTWSVWPIKSHEDFEFVPMLWGNSTAEDFYSNIEDVLEGTQPKITAVLGMNEPEQPGQSNMLAKEGAALWKKYVEPLRTKGVRLGSPAPAGGPSGTTWLQGFLKECKGGCTIDFIATHWYSTDANAFIAFLNEYHDTFKKPIWITEWACQNFDPATASKQCLQDAVINFMNTTQAFMDNASFVERYAWFGAMKNLQGVNPANGLLDSSGKINCLGKQYAGAQNCSSVASSSKVAVVNAPNKIVLMQLLAIAIILIAL
ncbi:glycosyl hydrolase catalytic core-domain-containing protein [Crepidotus variabilis]|uniref:Glycosyl hydrolase catalytic core-domain-containing protein n=1 Tax=Crepidotus variabilis TaxID=179855 RepID=A0A9P6ECG7_9AGAR|nr:glycosyl hydrolase catalytic core-domain-containing protein [Crepidotus variabilis]